MDSSEKSLERFDGRFPVGSPDTFPPSVYLIGAQKSGTTTLAALLSRHPGILVSTPKEPKYFSHNTHLGLGWYRGCFRIDDDDEGRVLIDCSTSYTSAPLSHGPARQPSSAVVQRLPYASEVPRRIFDIRPDARFIYIVRDPVERCYSGYWHARRAGYEGRSFRNAVLEDPFYSEPSFYYEQISQFLPFFDLCRFLILDLRRLAADPNSIIRCCLEFIGVAEDRYPWGAAPRWNQTMQHNLLGRGLNAVLGRDGLEQLSIAIRNRTPLPLQSIVKRIIARPIPPMSDADREWAAGFFREDTERFSRLSGIVFENSSRASFE